MNTLISIVVPIYNVENQIIRCVESLLKQTYENIEIILVDDGSPDRCPQICDHIAQGDARVVVIHKKNGGLSDARNYGLRAANGEYVLFVDSDDYLDLRTCEKFLKCLHSEEDIIVGNAIIYNQSRIEHQGHSNLIEGQVYDSNEYLTKAISAGEWYAPVCYNLYRRAFLVENVLYFKKSILHEDMEYIPRVFLKANKIGYMDFEFYQYVIREGSITQTKSFDKNITDLMDIYSEWKKQFDNVSNKKLRKKLYGVLSKYYIATCRKYHIKDNIYPQGINNIFLLKYSLNSKEFIKTIAFNIFRRVYVEL